MNWTAIRNKRNDLLSRSDWTQLPDASVDKQAWATYRQALRDITETYANATDKSEIVWPVKPEV
jgi:hypothetical protein